MGRKVKTESREIFHCTRHAVFGRHMTRQVNHTDANFVLRTNVYFQYWMEEQS